MKLSQLLYHFYDPSLYNDIEIAGLAIDSRHVKPGYLFFAYPGTHLDGRKFIDDAIQNGAVAILAEVSSELTTFRKQKNVPIYPVHHLAQWIGPIASKFYGFPSKKLKVTGITGTNGKTSCCHFLAAVLQQAGIKCGVMGTLGNGLYGELEASSLTTSDPITIQATLDHFIKKHAKMVAMEVSSHSLEQGRVNGMEFEIGVFTNLTRDHLDYHGTMEAYGAAKKKLFDKSLTKNAVINVDDDFGKQLISDLLPLHNSTLFAYGTDKNIALPDSVPFICADKIKLNHAGITAFVETPWGSGKLKTSLMGQFNLSNLLAVLTTVCLLGMPFDEALHFLSHLSSVPGRMQTLGGGDRPLVVVDYAHTPDALEKALIALRAHCEGKLHCLFGCGGDRDTGKRPIMAKMAEKYADSVVVTDDNPRTEDPVRVVKDIMKGFKHPEKITVQHDRSKAIQEIIQYACAQDCVLIAGKGAETFQLIGDKKIPFSDVEKVKENLGEN